MQYTLVGNEDGTKNLTVFQEGEKPLTAHSTHPNFETIITGLMKDDEAILGLFDIAFSVGSKFEKLTERISVQNGIVYLDGETMDNALTGQILRFLENGEDFQPLANFYENLASNPSQEAVEELYAWIDKNQIPITPDGMMLGYKGLTSDGNGGFKSSSSGKAIVDGVVYEGQIPQNVGSVVEMPRSEVEYDPDRDCGVGLHVGSYGYAQSYARPGLFEVHVNPRDVISVPHYGTKLRCCRYVIAKSAKDEVTKPLIKDVKPKKQGKLVKGDKTVRKGDVYRDRDPRRPRDLKVISKATTGDPTNVIVVNVDTGKETEIGTDRLVSRFDRIKRGKK